MAPAPTTDQLDILDAPATTQPPGPDSVEVAQATQAAQEASASNSSAPTPAPVALEKPERRVTLFDLERRYLELISFFDEVTVEGITPDADAQLAALAEELVALQESAESKVCGWAKWIRSVEADAEIARAESRRLGLRASAFESLAAKLRETLKGAMLAMDVTKVKGALFTVSVKKSPPSVASVSVPDLPTKFLKPPAAPEPDRKAILDEWKRTKVAPPGVVIREDGKSLEIR